jgi:APA family basic amino acid/polyamine antiporter
LATAFELNGVHWAAAVISIGALAGLTTVILVVMLGQTRVLFAMSRDGLLPPALARTGARGTPMRMTLTVGALVGLVAALLAADKLVEMVNIGTLFAFVLVSTAVVVLRRTRPELPRPFRTPLVPLIPILAVLACGWLMLNLTALTWLRFLAWLALGLAVYLGYGRRHSRLAE